MPGKVEEDVLTIAALGRPFRLGMLYDCRSDKILHGLTLWDASVLKEKNYQNHKTADFEIIGTDTIDDKSCALNVNLGLKLSFLGGLVDVSGSGKYLDNRKSSNHVERVTLQYKCTTGSEQMTMEQLGKGRIQHPEAFDHGIATHVVTGITYGGHAFFVFERDKSSSDHEVSGKLKAYVGKIPTLDLGGEGEVKISKDEKKDVQNFSCKYFGDFLPKENPSTYDDAVRLYKDLPNLIGDQGENAVPVTIHLHPLALLDSKACKMVREISPYLVKETEKALEDLYELDVKCNDLLNSKAAQNFQGIQRDIKNFKSLVNSYKMGFQKELSCLLPGIRGGGEQESVLADLLKKKELSPFGHNALTGWLETKESQVKILSEYILSLSQIKYASKPGDLQALVRGPNHFHVLSFSILMPKCDIHLEKMQKYMNKQYFSNNVYLLFFLFFFFISFYYFSISLPYCVCFIAGMSVWFITVKEFQIPPTTVDNTCTMMEKARHFKDFFQANKDNSSIAFIISEDSSESREFQARLRLYSNGSLIQNDFAIPSAPSEVTVEESTITHDSVLLKWKNPLYGVLNVNSYQIFCDDITGSGFDVTLSADSNATSFTVSGLEPGCKYQISVQSACEVGVSLPCKADKTVKTVPCTPPSSDKSVEEILKNKICKKSKVLDEGDLNVHKPDLKIVATDDQNKLQKFRFGAEMDSVPEKVIMVVGSTGSGKTTLINGIVNYIFGVKWSDSFRFKMITEPRSDNQAQSQTSKITSYTLYHQEGYAVPYTLTIIDTPGFGDVQGIERDKEITEQIRIFFTTGGLGGIDHLDAVGFVAQSSLPRLTPTQRYIFDKILSLFGRDIGENIFMLLTFADGQSPQVLSGIREAGMPYKKYFKFNNSALYASNKIQNDDDGGNFDSMFWKMGEIGFKLFLEELNTIETKSLTLTKDVLKERNQLEVYICGIQRDIQVGLNKLEQLKKEEEFVTANQADIDKNKNFEYVVTEEINKEVPIPRGQYITNCMQCNRTCHEVCSLSNDDEKYRCWAMKDGSCRICPSECIWSVHRNVPFKYVCEKREVIKTAEDLRKRYQEAQEKKLSAELLVKMIKDEFEAVQFRVLGMIDAVKQSLQRLKEIALKPDPLSTVEYIDILIQSERNQADPGWQDRVDQLQDVRKQAEYLKKVADEGLYDPFSKYKKKIQEEEKQNKKGVWSLTKKYVNKMTTLFDRGNSRVQSITM